MAIKEGSVMRREKCAPLQQGGWRSPTRGFWSSKKEVSCPDTLPLKILKFQVKCKKCPPKCKTGLVRKKRKFSDAKKQSGSRDDGRRASSEA